MRKGGVFNNAVVYLVVGVNFCEIDGQLRNVAKEIEGPVDVWTKETGVALKAEKLSCI
jgi:hypothetical protein